MVTPVYVDDLDRAWCASCANEMPTTPIQMLEYLMHTIPFEVGDRVECRTGGVLYDGVGVIQEMSIEPRNFGTPVHPSFRVRIEDKAYPDAPDECWYMEPQLQRVPR